MNVKQIRRVGGALLMGAIVGLATSSLAQTLAQWKFLDQTTGKWVDVKECPPPAVYLTTTLPPSTPSPTIIKILDGQAGKIGMFDGAALYTDPGAPGVAKILTGDDATCQVNQHELETTIVSVLGSSFFPREASFPGQYICLQLIGGMKVNGGATAHVK